MTQPIHLKKISFLSLGLVWLLSVGLPSLSLAQKHDREAQRDKIRTLKVGIFTEKLDLTAAQAEKFWPLYNEYFGQKRKIKKEIRSKMRASKDDTLTDEMRIELQDDILQLKKESLDHTAAYRDRFLEVISVKQYSQLNIAEEQFNTMLLKELRKRKRDS